jgi:hypothetical protein
VLTSECFPKARISSHSGGFAPDALTIRNGRSKQTLIRKALAESLQEQDSGVGFDASLPTRWSASALRAVSVQEHNSGRLKTEHRTLNTPLAEPGSASGSRGKLRPGQSVIDSRSKEDGDDASIGNVIRGLAGLRDGSAVQSGESASLR